MWSAIRRTCCVTRASQPDTTELRTQHNAYNAIRNLRTVIGPCRLAPAPRCLHCLGLSRTNAPSIRRHYPASSVLRASPPPCRPELILTGFRFSVGACASPTGLAVLHPLPCACMLSPLTRQRRPASFVRASLGGTGRWQPSPCSGRVGLRVELFEACSAFTRVMDCTLAESLMAALFHRSASVHLVPSTNRSDCCRLERTICRARLPPLGCGALARRTRSFTQGWILIRRPRQIWFCGYQVAVLHASPRQPLEDSSDDQCPESAQAIDSGAKLSSIGAADRSEHAHRSHPLLWRRRNSTCPQDPLNFPIHL